MGAVGAGASVVPAGAVLVLAVLVTPGALVGGAAPPSDAHPADTEVRPKTTIRQTIRTLCIRGVFQTT